MNRKEKGKQLELWVLSHFKNDKLARLSRASGASNDIGDVVTSDYFIECKKWNRECVTLSMKTWNKLVNQLPINTQKQPIYVYENKQGKRFVIMDAEDFFENLRRKEKSVREEKEKIHKKWLDIIIKNMD